MNYNNIASKYDERYESGQLSNIEKFLFDIINQNHFKNIVDIGCGTGHWLNAIPTFGNLYGCDLSIEMLKIARNKNLQNLILCNALRLPFKSHSFDFIFLVNAFHQFDNKIDFIAHSFALLTQNGALAIICVDPANKYDKWYVYEYFDGVYEKDLKRFPRWDEIKSWMSQVGFRNVEDISIEKIYKKMINDKVLKDKFLLKHNSSQLANLSDDAYTRGVKKIQKQIEFGLENNIKVEFLTDITFKAIVGYK